LRAITSYSLLRQNWSYLLALVQGLLFSLRHAPQALTYFQNLCAQNQFHIEVASY
jgi:hypothetical protein